MLAQLLINFSTGIISNDEFEDELINLFSEKQYSIINYTKNNTDPLFKPLLQYCWCLYDDSYNYKLKGKHTLTSDQLIEVNRIILFLKSDLEYSWPYVDLINPVLRFSFKDVLLNLITFGRLSKEARISRDKAFQQMKKEGDFEYWPFKTKRHYQEELKAVLFK